MRSSTMKFLILPTSLLSDCSIQDHEIHQDDNLTTMPIRHHNKSKKYNQHLSTREHVGKFLFTVVFSHLLTMREKIGLHWIIKNPEFKVQIIIQMERV